VADAARRFRANKKEEERDINSKTYVRRELLFRAADTVVYGGSLHRATVHRLANDSDAYTPYGVIKRSYSLSIGQIS